MGGIPAAELSSEAQNGSGSASSDLASATKPMGAASKPSRKRPTSLSDGKAAPRAKTRKPAARNKPKPAETAVSDEEIRLRAYFIAERRMQNGTPGDSSTDWLAARRQLLEEAAGRA